MTAIDDALPVVESVQDIVRLAQAGFEDWASLFIDHRYKSLFLRGPTNIHAFFTASFGRSDVG
jgi:hypothetical protein